MTVLERVRRLACVAAVALTSLMLASPAQAGISVTITDVDNPTDTVTYSNSSNAVSVGTPGAIQEIAFR